MEMIAYILLPVSWMLSPIKITGKRRFLFDL